MSEFNVKPDWYARLQADDQFPGRTFTLDKMARMERRILSPIPKRRIRWWRVSALGAVVAMACLAFWLLAEGPFSHHRQTNQVPAIIPPAQTPVPTSTQQSQDYHEPFYNLKGEVETSDTPQQFWTYSAFVAELAQLYSIAEVDGEFSRIVAADGQSGWIPSWYLISELEQHALIEKVNEPYEMIVDKPVAYRLYPDELKPQGFELWEGKVVQVVKTLGDWVAVKIITYDSPYMGDKWLRKDELIAYDVSRAREGYCNLNTVLYDENGVAGEQILGLDMLYIKGEQDGRYHITVAGGISGYIDKADFIPNPFSLKIVNQSGDQSEE